MGRYAKDSGGGDFEKAPAGTHVAICYRVIDLGTHHSEYEGKPQVKNQILVSWELAGELMTDGKPFSVSRFYTNSLSEKANLRKDLVAWRGRDFTDSELEKFDLMNILGKPCLVSVIHSKDKAKVSAVLALPKGTPVPKLVNDRLAFFIDEWDDALYEQVPKGIRGIIEKSDEYHARMSGADMLHEDDSHPADLDMEADIPF